MNLTWIMLAAAGLLLMRRRQAQPLTFLDAAELPAVPRAAVPTREQAIEQLAGIRRRLRSEGISPTHVMELTGQLEEALQLKSEIRNHKSEI